MMSAIKGRDTKPELLIRKALHRLGFRYSLHSGGMPGKPDVVLPKYRAVIWINGCFWHGHGCAAAKLPASRIEYWGPKIDRTHARDLASAAAIANLGWRSLTIWECCIRGKGAPGVDWVAAKAAEWLVSGDTSAALDRDSIGESL